MTSLRKDYFLVAFLVLSRTLLYARVLLGWAKEPIGTVLLELLNQECFRILDG